MQRASLALSCVVVAVLVAALSGGVRAQRSESSTAFIVIAHPNNPSAHISRSFLSDAFLKRVTRWPDGQTIQPIDLGAESPIRQRFVTDIIGRSVPAVRTYWQQIIFSGRGVPPIELPNDGAVVRYVVAHRGAVGYVSSFANIRNTRVIEVR